MVCTDPTGHVRVLRIVVVCVCRLSEEYVCGVGVYVCVCVVGGGIEGCFLL